jgi:hypothetical protein
MDGSTPPSAQLQNEPECMGWQIIFPAGKPAHGSYPFVLHDEHALPWGYEFYNGVFTLRANSTGAVKLDGFHAAGT